MDKTIPFDAWGQKIADNYENVFSFKTAEIQALLGKKNPTLEDAKSLFSLDAIQLGKK
ncbi:hypothetical protein H6768_01215 [Candidatus Peribacteria bacterium]|nr:hypothetical protein [Candidatus Peribacteria bacterium]